MMKPPSKRLWIVCAVAVAGLCLLFWPTKHMNVGATDCYLQYEECYSDCYGDSQCQQSCQITYQACDTGGDDGGGSCPTCGYNCARVASNIMYNCRTNGYVPTMYQPMYNTCRANGGSVFDCCAEVGNQWMADRGC